jgi:CRISPR-associated endoribonuclease Cas6
MRLKINLSKNNAVVPFNYNRKLTGVVHRWLGEENNLHGNVSLYSFSGILNAKLVRNGLNYPFGAEFFISFHEENYLKKIIESISNDNHVLFGMNVTSIDIQDNPDLSQKNIFKPGSPIFVSRVIDNNKFHYTYEDENTNLFLVETLKKKMKIAGLPDDNTLKIEFYTSYPKKRIKINTYGNTKNKVNDCPVIIEGTNETKVFAWNVGLGNSTGIGYGSIY